MAVGGCTKTHNFCGNPRVGNSWKQNYVSPVKPSILTRLSCWLGGRLCGCRKGRNEQKHLFANCWKFLAQ